MGLAREKWEQLIVREAEALQKRRRAVEEHNAGSLAAWRSEVARLQQLRVQVAQRDPARRRAWELERDRLLRVRAQVGAENEKRRRAWQQQCQQIQEQREAAERVNAAIRAKQTRYEAEMNRRQVRLTKHKAQLDKISHTWAHEAERARREFNARMDELRAVKNDYDSLKGAFEQDRYKVLQNQYAAQLRSFLERKMLDDADIPSIGVARKATLASYGIETAADIHEAALGAIPGFGEVLCGNLLAWRQSVEKQFLFDPRRMTNPSDDRQLVMKYRPAKRRLQRQLLLGKEDVARIAEAARKIKADLEKRAAPLIPAVAQAKADISAAAIVPRRA